MHDGGGRKFGHDSLVNLPNAMRLTFRFEDGAWFCARNIESCHEILDMARGMTEREITAPLLLEYEGRRHRLAAGEIFKADQPLSSKPG